MSKADRDPLKRPDAPPSTEDKPLNATEPEDIPPIHVLEAMQAQERKETEDLLAGFDRPGRTPRQPASRDFVDYHLKREKSAPRSEPPVSRGRSKHDVSTFIVPRKNALAPYLPWAGAVVAMIGLGVLFAFVMTGPSPSADAAKNASAVPSAATTISAASAPTIQREHASDVPLPPETSTAPPASVESASPPPSASVKRDPKPPAVVTTETPTSSAPSPPQVPPTSTIELTPPLPTSKRGDFIRDL